MEKLKNRIQSYEMMQNRDDRLNFYDELQKTVKSVNRNDTVILAGDFNACLGIAPIEM